MRNLLNSKWLFFINTLPIVVLTIIFFGQFHIIQTLLDANTIRLWKIFGLTLGILGALNFAYALYLTFKKKNVSPWYGALALLAYIPFIYLYAYYLGEIFPFGIPQWMMSGNIFLYVGTFLMPTLAYSLFVLVTHFTPENKTHKAWANFLIAASIPVAAYLFSQTVLPLWQNVENKFFIHAFLVLTIITTLVFLFFLIRSIFILAAKKAAAWQKYSVAWKIPVAIVFPVLGLLLNNGHIYFNKFWDGYAGIFGDFNHVWFYILAALNGIFVCLPNLENKTYRLFLFIARSMTFAYTLYFFLVFLPFLPLSIVAILAAGVGFLMLTPLLLFVLHASELSKDFQYLKNFFATKIIVAVLLLGFSLIPMLITASYIEDKSVLNRTLAYLYSPDYSQEYNIDKVSLQKTLRTIANHKDHRDARGGIFGNGIPYLSPYFNWLVMDNMTLSDTKINFIERVFFGESPLPTKKENPRNQQVAITKISANNVYEQSQKAWKSWVDLEITNQGNNNFEEYASTIDLPDGCFISDYYLFVGDKKEFGILAEKKSAMWIFSNIRNEKRDPGILYYLTGNKIAFKIFPFSKNEVRKTGIEFLHKDPVVLSFDGNAVELGANKESENEKIENDNFAYVSARQKQTLQTVKRKPYFHFLVDASKDKNIYADDFAKRIKQVLENYPALAENAKITFVNSYINTFSLTNEWEQKFQSQNFAGGFYLQRAIKTALLDAPKENTYPVIVAVTDNIQHAILDEDFSDLQFAFPESDLFFNLGDNAELKKHSLTVNPKLQLPQIKRECMFCETVLEYKLLDNSVAYLPNNNAPSFVLKHAVFKPSETNGQEKNWQSALTMQALWRSQILHPETANRERLNLVKYSFVSRVMSPTTSYLVVENEAQKAMLLKKQAQVLLGNKALDLDEDTQRMSEPSLWMLVILLGMIFWYREKRTRIKTTK